jgi:hypothetical protein
MYVKYVYVCIIITDMQGSILVLLLFRGSMSWWDAKGLTSLATQALKTAQKKIDKVLDIKEEDEEPSDAFTGDNVCTVRVAVATHEMSYVLDYKTNHHGVFVNFGTSKVNMSRDIKKVLKSGDTSSTV